MKKYLFLELFLQSHQQEKRGRHFSSHLKILKTLLQTLINIGEVDFVQFLKKKKNIVIFKIKIEKKTK